MQSTSEVYDGATTIKGLRTQMSAPINDPAMQAAVSAADHEYVFHSWSAQGAISPMPIASGSGSYFWDFEGKMDLS